ncbi:MAG: hypothetical protein JWN12_637 [Candidatus Saccharibacteria bacterium]|nr:hypothetical protein [Candidatus Saccharibacteria bacterium]
MTEQETIEEIKADFADKLGNTLRALNKGTPRWGLKGPLGFNRVKENLTLEIIEPRPSQWAEFRYSPLYRQDEYMVIVYQLQMDSQAPIGFGVLNTDPAIETFLEADTYELVEWIVSSEDETDVQISSIAHLHEIITEAERLLNDEYPLE